MKQGLQCPGTGFERQVWYPLPLGSPQMRHEHQEVVAALEAGDVKGGRDAIARQIIASRDRILEAILQGDIRSVQVGG